MIMLNRAVPTYNLLDEYKFCLLYNSFINKATLLFFDNLCAQYNPDIPPPIIIMSYGLPYFKFFY